jgi:hypothetical protein
MFLGGHVVFCAHLLGLQIHTGSQWGPGQQGVYKLFTGYHPVYHRVQFFGSIFTFCLLLFAKTNKKKRSTSGSFS